MAIKRINIMMDEKVWQRLHRQAKRSKQSASSLIREAVERVWFFDSEQKRRKAAYEEILKIRPGRSKTTIDYKAFINDGRRI